MKICSVAAVILLTLLGASAARAEPVLPRPLQNVGFDQNLDSQIPLVVPFTDEHGQEVALRDYFTTKPVIFVLAYYRCPMLCTLVLNGLVKGLVDVPFDAGRDFEVVVISIDSRETPTLAQEKKKTYVERYGRDGTAKGWHFLVGPPESITAVADAVGFRFAYDAARDEFAHASGIVMLTPEGRVSRYFYDVSFAPRDLRLGLVDASQHRIGSAVDQVLLFCFHYDPREGKYGPAVMTFVRAGGVVTLLALGAFWLVLYRYKPHESAATNQMLPARAPPTMQEATP
jgi:protein SCO1/2